MGSEINRIGERVVTATGKVVQLAMGSGRNGGGMIKLSEDGQKLLEAICARKGWSEAEALEQALNFTAQALHADNKR